MRLSTALTFNDGALARCAHRSNGSRHCWPSLTLNCSVLLRLGSRTRGSLSRTSGSDSCCVSHLRLPCVFAMGGSTGKLAEWCQAFLYLAAKPRAERACSEFSWSSILRYSGAMVRAVLGLCSHFHFLARASDETAPRSVSATCASVCSSSGLIAFRAVSLSPPPDEKLPMIISRTNSPTGTPRIHST